MGSDARTRERQELYQSRRWRKLRDYMVQQHPLCEKCLQEGKITPTQDVHHRLSPFQKGITEEEKDRRAFDEKNLMCLCRDCHIKEHHKGELTIKEKLEKYKD